MKQSDVLCVWHLTTSSGSDSPANDLSGILSASLQFQVSMGVLPTHPEKALENKCS